MRDGKVQSRSPYGERGLKSKRIGGWCRPRRRSPYGERGLKSGVDHGWRGRVASLSLRRAWIEIRRPARTPSPSSRRSPYGERGLKLDHISDWEHDPPSLSLRRAWIEIGCSGYEFPECQSFSLRRAWIEILISMNAAGSSCRSPYGERGLKCRCSRSVPRPVRRSPYGERGLK